MISIIEDDSIMIVNNDKTTYEYDPNDRYSDGYSYGRVQEQKFRDINEYFSTFIVNSYDSIYNHEGQTIPSTCRIYGQEQIDITKRNSQTFPNKYTILSEKVNSFLKSIGLETTDLAERIDPTGYHSYSSTKHSLFELIKYNPDGFFNKHKDKLFSKSTDKYIHTHMCLLYPPASLTTPKSNPEDKLEGGDIVFYINSEGEGGGEEITQTIKPSEFTKWTFVIFEQKILHQVLPTIKGTRYVFKTQIYKKNLDYVPLIVGECFDEVLES